MDDAKRHQNELKFDEWTEESDGGRTYYLRIAGRHGWSARYVKTVDRDERTLRFVQEIHDEAGTLAEVHQKFPVDTGHQKAR